MNTIPTSRSLVSKLASKRKILLGAAVLYGVATIGAVSAWRNAGLRDDSLHHGALLADPTDGMARANVVTYLRFDDCPEVEAVGCDATANAGMCLTTPGVRDPFAGNVEHGSSWPGPARASSDSINRPVSRDQGSASQTPAWAQNALAQADGGAGLPAEGAAAPAAGDGFITSGLTGGRLMLTMNKSGVLTTRAPYKRISVGSPDVADVNTIGPTSVLVNAKQVGSTQLIFWDDQDRSQIIDVEVAMDLQPLRDQLARMYPASNIEVTPLSGGAVALTGRVPNIETAERIMTIASPYSLKMINMMEITGGQQVMLQVRFMEVSRSAISALGVELNAGWASGDCAVNFTSTPGRVSNPDPAITLGGAGQFGNFAFDVFIDALKRNNLARVLAEPNVTVISGQEANFLAGGEFPVPVPQSGGAGTGGSTITIEYKEFGVRLRCVPVVLGDGRIRMRVSPEVSDLDFTNSVSVGGLPVPGLKTRKVDTTVEMVDGQSFAIAGLLNRKLDAKNTSTPFLGDIPVLGMLFRSVRYERSETELVVLVTPRLVEPMNPDGVPLLPGEQWFYPSDIELFVSGELGGPGPVQGIAPRLPDAPAPRYQGRTGFVAPDGATAQ
jgi:pilus assembly protein CpaC